MDFTIRKATQKDLPEVLALVTELAIYEKAGHEVTITLEELEKDGFGENPKFQCFVAESNNKIEAMALVYKRYSTWKGTVLHLEDLIVSKDMRGRGLGTLLLNEVVRYGNKLGVKRICWEVLDWNKPAIEFYKEKGAKILKDWHVVQLKEAAIKNYLSRI